MEDKTISQQVMKHVLIMLDEEFAALSVGKLAQLFEMDRYKLSRQFKSQTGMTVEEFLYKEKMTRAALLLLASGDIDVKKVAESIGFCSPDYFIRKFRQFYGVVPGKYSEFKAKRPGIRDRRKRVNDRRQKVRKSKIPNTGDRRTGQKDRGNGRKDRRRQRNNHHDSDQNPDMKAFPVQKEENAKSCENCYFKKFALNFDDWK